MAVKQVGAEPFRVAQECVDEVILVSTDEICAAIKDIYEDTRSIAEPAGALGVAGLEALGRARAARGPATLVAIESGANLNFDRLRYISERTETGAHAEVLLAVTIPEEKGSFRRFCGVLGEPRASPSSTTATRDADARRHLRRPQGQRRRRRAPAAHRRRCAPAAIAVTDLTDNELAKLHVRHLVGGRAAVPDEVLYRFEFPERPGALLRFLNQMGERWNISLFHYRNHGAADGRVLAGIQVAPADQPGLPRISRPARLPVPRRDAQPGVRVLSGRPLSAGRSVPVRLRRRRD